MLADIRHYYWGMIPFYWGISREKQQKETYKTYFTAFYSFFIKNLNLKKRVYPCISVNFVEPLVASRLWFVSCSFAHPTKMSIRLWRKALPLSWEQFQCFAMNSQVNPGLDSQRYEAKQFCCNFGCTFTDTVLDGGSLHLSSTLPEPLAESEWNGPPYFFRFIFPLKIYKNLDSRPLQFKSMCYSVLVYRVKSK